MASISKIQISDTLYDLKDPALAAVDGIVKCDGSGTLAAAVEGTDYQAPLSASQTLWYGTCSTGASTQAKAVTIAGITKLEAGLHITVKFTNAQTYNGVPTLNVNSLGAKNIRRTDSANAARYEWYTGEVLNLVYDGTYWVIIDGNVATTTYYGVTKLATSATSTSTSLAMTPASLNNFWLNCISPFPTFLTSQDYAVGDYVRYSYNVYRCKTATEAGAWADVSANFDEMPTIWELIQTVSSDVDAKADLTALNAKADLTALNSKADLTALNGKADWNMLDIASPAVTSNAFTLSSNVGIYRVTASVAGGAATIPIPSVANIPTRQSYFCFDMEVAIGAAATSLVGPSGWAWCEDGELPISDFAGKTLYISVRFDCQARTFLANVWRIA